MVAAAGQLHESCNADKVEVTVEKHTEGVHG